MGGRVRLILAMLGGGLALALVPAVAGAAGGGNATVCSGSLPPGTYHSIVVPAGQTCDLGDGPATVLAGVSVGPGATFSLGHEQPRTPPTSTIGGGVSGDNAAQVQIHNARITGGVNLQGGAGPNCGGGPCFSDLEDDVVNGGATINGYDGFWLGFIRNTVAGTTTITNNHVPDEIDLGSNTVKGALRCGGNNPLENTGDSPGAPNTVTGQDTCNENPA
jgi:hypothetical protein